MSAGSPVDRRELEAVLEQTRQNFHKLVDSLSEDQLALSSVVSRWTVKELLCHMSRVMEIAFTMMVRRAKKNKRMPRTFHTSLAHWFNYQAPRWSARRADREQLLRKYDVAHDHMVSLLRGVEDHQWKNTTSFPSGTPLTMEEVDPPQLYVPLIMLGNRS